MKKNELLKKILYINLTDKSYEIKHREDLFQKYIGGSGVAINLLNEECPEEIDAFDENNPIIFSIGNLTGIFPIASKTVSMFKSPLTKNLGESHAGGRSAIAMRMADIGAIVIKGKSDIPIYLAIYGNKVYFRDATTLWGMKSSEVVGKIIRENENFAGLRTIMRIGRAGEEKIPFASVITETYRHFGRLGLGAVFGSKNLKAIMIAGKHEIQIENSKKYKNLYDEIFNKATTSEMMKKYHDLGTPQNVIPLNELKALPTRNLQSSYFETAENISGENFAKHHLGRRLACAHCPVACIHIAALREPYTNEPYFYKTSMISYDYELIYSLGTMLGISKSNNVLKIIQSVEEVGIDGMSTGVILAWATEAYKKGIITDNQVDGVAFEWGEYAEYIKAIDKIINPPNKFYKDLSKGVYYASRKYGGNDYALSFGKNEMPGYHTGPAAYLGFMLGARHSHLDSGGYSIDQKILSNKSLTHEEIVDKLIEEESWRQILSSLVVCFFARKIYSEEVVSKCLGLLGCEDEIDKIKNLGIEIYKKKFDFKFREGFDFNNMEIPKRIVETRSPTMKFDKKFIQKALKYAEEKIKNNISKE
ncbi:MAG: aldehyde:ferredoxin oxidoreductase [Candidatus Mcinerneyibacterium aminivorans]|uniref:Aldehyde:ferredoxin oxidoreductase n=1 Tax=Candidatus Mcinerneyibacterium aminivorans TaxID=2703815 RepID=A0A5D0MCN5_9BACT|nr:MAG: aldehyde:ferredoxin oxidoreductase [Candidatus Mcinerneyibacterium aminivorans]